MSENKMKLYAWNSPYGVPYGASCVFALGENEDAARTAAKQALIWEYGHGVPEPRMPKDADLDRAADLILEAGAVCYEWSE